MAHPTLAVERRPAQDFADVQMWIVKKPDTNDFSGVHVHWSPRLKRAFCCKCHGPMAAMLSSCQHAKVVKAHALKATTVEAKPALLSKHARAELEDMACKPVPRSGVNPGVARKITAEGWARSVQLPSPFKNSQGRTVEHLEITQLGLDMLAQKG